MTIVANAPLAEPVAGEAVGSCVVAPLTGSRDSMLGDGVMMTRSDVGVAVLRGSSVSVGVGGSVGVGVAVGGRGRRVGLGSTAGKRVVFGASPGP